MNSKKWSGHLNGRTDSADPPKWNGSRENGFRLNNEKINLKFNSIQPAGYWAQKRRANIAVQNYFGLFLYLLFFFISLFVHHNQMPMLSLSFLIDSRF